MHNLEFKKWIDDKREADGSINLSKHPDLIEYIEYTFGNIFKKINMDEFNALKNGLGSTLSFDLTKWKKNDI